MRILGASGLPAEPATEAAKARSLYPYDAILKADREAPRKQRHTGRRIFERLRDEHGFKGGITIVTDYVREARHRTAEKFVPLAHPPGHAQVDFGEAIGLIGGVRRKLHLLHELALLGCIFHQSVSSRDDGSLS